MRTSCRECLWQRLPTHSWKLFNLGAERLFLSILLSLGWLTRDEPWCSCSKSQPGSLSCDGEGHGFNSFLGTKYLVKIYFPSSFTDALIDSEGYKGIPLWKVILPGRELARGFIFQNDSVLKLTSKKCLEENRTRILAYGKILWRTIAKNRRIKKRWILIVCDFYSSGEVYTQNKLLKYY
jgi:hypothetical protein